jgi:hypothetical protein
MATSGRKEDATMSKKKRESKVLARAEKRLVGLKSIDEALNLGDGISVKTLSQAVAELSAANGAYNRLLADADAALIHVRRLEAGARELLERSLALVAGKYGRDSTQYAQAGGKRRSDRKRRGQAKRAEQRRAAHKLLREQQQVQQAQLDTSVSGRNDVAIGTANGHAASTNGQVAGEGRS